MPTPIAVGVTAIIANPKVASFTDQDFIIISPKSTVDVTISYVKIMIKNVCCS